MLRRSSKSTNFDITLGPPLRLTDIERYTPSEVATKECIEEKENIPDPINRSSCEDEDVKPSNRSRPVCIDQHHRENTPRSNNRQQQPTPQNPLTHPSNYPPFNQSRWSQQIKGDNVIQTPTNSQLVIGPRKLKKLSLLGRGGSSQVSVQSIFFGWTTALHAWVDGWSQDLPLSHLIVLLF